MGYNHAPIHTGLLAHERLGGAAPRTGIGPVSSHRQWDRDPVASRSIRRATRRFASISTFGPDRTHPMAQRLVRESNPSHPIDSGVATQSRHEANEEPRTERSTLDGNRTRVFRLKAGDPDPWKTRASARGRAHARSREKTSCKRRRAPRGEDDEGPTGP